MTLTAPLPPRKEGEFPLASPASPGGRPCAVQVEHPERAQRRVDEAVAQYDARLDATRVADAGLVTAQSDTGAAETAVTAAVAESKALAPALAEAAALDDVVMARKPIADAAADALSGVAAACAEAETAQSLLAEQHALLDRERAQAETWFEAHHYARPVAENWGSIGRSSISRWSTA